jgi:DNA-binding response OmpR family regulator
VAHDVPIRVVLIDPSGRGRTQEMAVLRAAGMDVHLVTSVLNRPTMPGDVVVADLRPNEQRPGAVLRAAFELQRPVLVITNPNQVDARLAALRHGAVDHVVSPTEARELVERVRHAASVARTPRPANPSLDVDPAGRQVRCGDRSVTVTPSEMAVLQVLVDRSGEVVSKAQLADALPGQPRPNTVEAHVSGLRRKLSSIGAPPIKTVHRQGYLFRPVAGPARAPVRVRDLISARERLVQQRNDFVRRREEILQATEHLRHQRDDGDGRRDPPR